MKIVHTSYVITSLVFILLAAQLLTEQPVPMPSENPVMENAKKEQANQVRIQKASRTDSANLNGLSQSNGQAEDIHAGYPKVRVVATGYYAGVESTGKDPGHPQYGITYSGVKVRRDMYSTIAADLNLFSLGTILYIPDYGYGVVSDIGSAIKGNIIDLYFESIDDIYSQWGKREVDVYVIKKGEGVVTEAMLNELNSGKMVQAHIQPK